MIDAAQKSGALCFKPRWPMRICDWVASDANQQRGELVLVLSPAAREAGWSERDQALAKSLLAELPMSRAAKVLAAHTGMKRQEVYGLLEAMNN